MKLHQAVGIVFLLISTLSVCPENSYRVKLSSGVLDSESSTKSGADLYGSMNFRYLRSHSTKHWALDLHLVSEMQYRPEIDQSFQIAPLPQIPAQRRAHWVLNEGSNHSTSILIDRAQLTYKTNNFRASIGRFPTSWGRGLVFHPLDVFSAFAPTIVDQEFKQGNDSLLLEYVHQSGSEVHLLATARKESNYSNRPTSTFALKYSLPIGMAEFEFGRARHYGDEILSISGAVPILDSVVRADFVRTCAYEDYCLMSVVSNIDYTFSVGGNPLYLFGEYFFNDLGVRILNDGYHTVPDALIARLVRGDLFTFGRHLLALGTHASWHPLWNYNGTVLTNLNDASVLWQNVFTFAPTDSTSLSFGFRMSFGGVNEEFGRRIVDDRVVGQKSSIFADFIYFK